MLRLSVNLLEFLFNERLYRMKQLTALIALLLLFLGCSLDEKVQPLDEHTDGDPVILGKQLENPYSVANMKRAKGSLETRGYTVDAEITATHYYIRFAPRDTNELGLLEKDTALTLFETPLDFELLSGGTCFNDPSLKPGELLTYYTAVPVDQELPNVPYLILEELYIPDESSVESRMAGALFMLEEEALEITGNSDSCVQTRGFTGKGTVRVYDDLVKKNLPVAGLNVRVRNWFRFKSGYTNNSGYYSLSGFKGRNGSFSIKWEHSNERFDIRNGSMGQAFTVGPARSTSWSPTFSSGEDQFRAQIFRAGRTWIDNSLNLASKPFNTISIKGKWGYTAPSQGVGLYMSTTRNVSIWGKTNGGSRRKASDVFFTTLHELGHAYHDYNFESSGTWAVSTTEKLRESWAVASSYYLAMDSYAPKTLAEWLQLPNLQNGQKWYDAYPELSAKLNTESKQHKTSGVYIPFIIDLIDTENQYRITDRVSGYTLEQISNELKKKSCGNLEDLKNGLKDNYNNPTEIYLDELYNQFN